MQLQKTQYMMNSIFEIVAWTFVMILRSVLSGDYLYYGDGWRKFHYFVLIFALVHLITLFVLWLQWKRRINGRIVIDYTVFILFI